MEMAIPPKDMMLALIPSRFITRSDATTLEGTTKTATSSLRRWIRNRMQTSPTTMISSRSVLRSVWTDRLMSSERS